MANKGDINEFNALVEKCTGSGDKSVQMTFLVKILKEFVSKRSGHGSMSSDDNVLKILGMTSVEGMLAAMNQPGDIYSALSRLLLENPGLEWRVVRWEVQKYIQER